MRRIKAPAQKTGCQKSAVRGRDFIQGGMLAIPFQQKRQAVSQYLSLLRLDLGGRLAGKSRRKIPFMFSAYSSSNAKVEF
jgi:hypothetical protein